MIPLIIPARSGSKSVPDKNIRQLKGVTLLERAINTARSSGLVVFVSSDSENYLTLAQICGANPIHRPAALAEDVPTEDVVIHALDYIQKYFPYKGTPEIVVTMQCTTPLVDKYDVNGAIQRYLDSEYFNSLASVTEVRENPAWMFEERDGELKPFISIPTGNIGIRQTLPRLVRPNGAIYITNVEKLRQTKSLWAEPIGYWEMPAERSFDVDTELDLKVIEGLLN